MDGRSPETCAECLFDARAWRVRDAATLLGALGEWWRMALRDVPPDDLNARPASGVWSALEYGLHTSMVTAALRAGIEMILAEDGCELPVVPASEGNAASPMRLDADTVLAAIEREGRAITTLAVTRGAPWTNVGRHGDSPVQAEAALLHAAHDASHHFMDVSRGLAALGAGTAPGRGVIERINLSDGGVPKRAIANAVIDADGVQGDRQADRKHHGRPFQALCLWSADVIDELRADGHPIAYGNAGENLTIRGVDWSALRAGTRLRVGTALAELSYPAVPCRKQTRWFSDGDFNRISYGRNPHLVRWYAWVRGPGDVACGDEVVVQPRDASV